MKQFAFTAVLLSFALPAMADELIEFGREIAQVNCASCHAISTDDASQHPEAPPLRELSARYPLDALAEAFVQGIYVGHPDMPEFEATVEQVDALLAYLDTIQNPVP
ncbi:MAG: cytochrome c [Aliihoeflea sp.]|uniref:cytochrome c n=1 Tax=Aliihoeflea sp. TaxID=2608088 RepID=UPI004037DBE2